MQKFTKLRGTNLIFHARNRSTGTIMLSSYQLFGKDYFGLSQRIDDLFSSSEDDISNNFMCEAGKALEQIQVADHITKLGNAFASKLRAEIGESSAELTCTTDQSSTMLSSSTPSKNIWSMTPQEGELIFNPLSTWCQSVSPIVHRETLSPNSFKTSFVDTLNESLQSVQSNESTEQADACSITPVSWNGNNVAQSWNVFNGTQAKPQHVSRPSKLNANDLKGAYERLMNLKSPTLQQQVSSTSPSNAHKSLPSQYIDQNGNNPIISASYCGFCRNNGESEQIYKQHKLKDNLGRVTCPVLRVYVCPICQATGDEAHTLKYCPRSSKDEMNLFKVHETARTSAGKRRPLSLKRM